MGTAPSARTSELPSGTASSTIPEETVETHQGAHPVLTQPPVPPVTKIEGTVENLHVKAKTANEQPDPINYEGGDSIQQTGRRLRPRKGKGKSELSAAVSVASNSTLNPLGFNVQKKRKQQIEEEHEVDKHGSDVLSPETKPKKARKGRKTKDNPYGLTPGETPFPEWQAPSAAQCEDVHGLLVEMHGAGIAEQPKTIPAPSIEVAGCGQVPSVLDALMRTLLSGATTFTNADTMIRSLANEYKVLEEKGVGNGSINWNNVRTSELDVLVRTIRMGGLANNKAKNIKAILDMVYEENLERREAFLLERKTGQPASVFAAAERTNGQKDYEILMTDNNILSLDHLLGLSANEAMKQFTKYPGIGVKTAACVILFCLSIPCFAVDTHVNKFAKWLRWAPKNATENDVFSHLEVRCPDHLKYGLHQLFIRHGKTCEKCKRSTAEGTESWKKLEDCPLEHLLDRYDKRQSKAKPKPPKKRKGKNDEEEAVIKQEGQESDGDGVGAAAAEEADGMEGKAGAIKEDEVEEGEEGEYKEEDKASDTGSEYSP
ncbi:hypothetical protein AAE478_008631 [Parahypoxylon ruwenzoriense]